MLKQITLGKKESPKKFTVELKANYDDVKKDIDKIMCNQKYIKAQSVSQIIISAMMLLIGLVTGSSFLLYYLIKINLFVFNVITNDIVTKIVKTQQCAIIVIVAITLIVYSVVFKDEMDFERAAKLFSEKKKATLDDDVELYRRVLTTMNRISSYVNEEDIYIRTAPYRFLLSPKLNDILGVSNNDGDFIYMEAGRTSYMEADKVRSCHIPVENEESVFLNIMHSNRVGMQVDYTEKLKLHNIKEEE